MQLENHPVATLSDAFDRPSWSVSNSSLIFLVIIALTSPVGLILERLRHGSRYLYRHRRVCIVQEGIEVSARQVHAGLNTTLWTVRKTKRFENDIGGCYDWSKLTQPTRGRCGYNMSQYRQRGIGRLLVPMRFLYAPMPIRVMMRNHG